MNGANLDLAKQLLLNAAFIRSLGLELASCGKG